MNIARSKGLIKMRVNLMERRTKDAYSIEKLAENLRMILSDKKDVSIGVVGFPNQGWIDKIKTIFLANGKQAEINHITGDIHFASFLMNRNKTIITMHDCIKLMNEDYGPLKKLIYKFIWFTLPNLRCRQIVAVSNETKKNLIKYANIPGDKIEVIYNGLNSEFRKINVSVQEKKNLLDNPSLKPTVLHISNSFANKNFNNLIIALKDMDIKLIKVGIMDKRDAALLRALKIDYTQFVNIPVEKLVKIYNSVDCLVFPSLIEGFGLPIIEAQACHCPVITSNQSSMPEVAGKGALLVEPSSVEDIRKAIINLLGDGALRKKLIKEGINNINRFKWGDIALRYYDLYKKMYNPLS